MAASAKEEEKELTDYSNTKFTARFTLEQTGLEGDVISKLEMFPKIKYNETEFPVVFEMISDLMLYHLTATGTLDAKGNLIDKEKFHNEVKIEVTENPNRGN